MFTRMTLHGVIEPAESTGTANLCGALIHSYVTASAECVQLFEGLVVFWQVV